MHLTHIRRKTAGATKYEQWRGKEVVKNKTSISNGRESVHCSEAGEGHKGHWHITKEMINGFGICINFFSVKSHEDFCWLFLPRAHKSKTHTLH